MKGRRLSVFGLCAMICVLLFVVGVLVLHGVGSRSDSGSSRVMAEIMGMDAALESYRADHGHYPSDPATSEKLGPNAAFDPAAYVPASEFLYRALSGDLDPQAGSPGSIDGKRYYVFKPEMLRTTMSGHTYVVDPMGNSYGYSTLKAAHPKSPDGENPTFDLWSTGGHKRPEDRSFWARNW